MAVVGIDLGTTNTVIAAVRDGRAAALKDHLGKALLPSVISFPPKGEPKIGYEAKDRRTIDPENTVFSIKRLIGRTWDSEHVRRSIERFPFELKEGPGKGVLVECRGQDYTLPEISALVLGRAREIAEARLGRAVSDAVITVPANFNDLQRAATKVAGRTAGLQVLRILNEPTAAALAYGFGKKGRERIAVYDFGGGTFDVTLLDLSENVFEVLATAGDTFLGGDDLDEAIAERMGEELLKKHRVDMSTDALVREQLRAAAERLKIDLSTRSMSTMHVPEVLADGGDFEYSMRRSEFEKLAEPYISRTLEVCQQALDVASVSIKDLDQVLLVGGSTRIPLVRRRISSFFGKMPQSRINPDEVVAIGAAIQASALESKMGASELPGPPVAGSIPPSGRTSAFPTGKRVTMTGLNAPLTGAGPSERPLGTTQTGLAGLKKTFPGATPSPVMASAGTRPSAPPRLDGQPAAAAPLAPPRSMMTTLAGVGGAPDVPPAQAAGPGQATGPGQPAGSRQLDPMKTLSGVGQPSPALGPLTQRGMGPGREKGGGPHQSLGPQELVGPRTLPGVGAEQRGPRTLTGLGAAPAGAELAAQARKDAARPPGLNEPTDRGDDADEDPTARHQVSGPEELDEDAFDDVTSVMKLSADMARAQDRAIRESQPEGMFADFARQAPPEPAEDGSVSFDLAELVQDEETTERDLERPEEILDDEEITDLPVASRPPPAEEEVMDLPARSVRPPVEEEEVTDLPTRSVPPPHGPLLGRSAFDAAPPRGDAGRPMESVRPKPSAPPAQAAERHTPGAGAQSDAWGEVIGEEVDLPALSEPPPRFEYPASPERPAPPPAPVARPLSEAPAFAPAPGASPLARSPASMAPAPPARDRPAPRLAAPLLLDVTPLSLGVETVGGFVDTLIERNSPIPCERTRTFSTARDGQTVVRVRVSQGDANRFEDNTVLGEVELSGITAGPRGSAKIDVTFALDESGMLQVSARDQRTGLLRDARLRLLGLSDE